MNAVAVPVGSRPFAGPSLHFVGGWMATSLIGEVAAVGVAVLFVAIDPAIALVAAALEGVLLGALQRFLLAPWLGTRNANLWMIATLGGSLLGRGFEYLGDVGLGPFAIDWSYGHQIAGGLLLGFVIGALMGVPQAFALQSVVRGAWRWPLVRGAAWAIGLPLLLIGAHATPIVTVATSFTALLLIVVGGASLVVGAVEGGVLARMLRHRAF